MDTFDSFKIGHPKENNKQRSNTRFLRAETDLPQLVGEVDESDENNTRELIRIVGIGRVAVRVSVSLT